MKVENAMKMLAMVAGIFAARPGAAYTDNYRLYGNSCHSIMPGLMGEVGQHGLGNPSSTQALQVACPVTIPEENYTEGYIAFSGWARHATEPLSCTMNFSDLTGDVLKTATSKTTGADRYRIKYGDGVRVTPPAGYQKVLWLTCRIPPTYGGWMSILTSVYLTLTY